jgi:Rrf2 family protein
MKLSLRGEYALRALIVLGESYDHGIIRIQAISERQNIPKRFLEQILNDLRTGGFLESRRGVAGGYRLARAPKEITLGALIRHIQGALPTATDGRLPGGKRSDEVVGAIQDLMQEAQNAMFAVLDRVTVADLCERVRQQRGKTAAGFTYEI